MFFGLKKRILLTGIATVVITILCVAFIFIINLMTFYKNNTQNELNIIHQNLAHTFDTYIKKMDSAINIIGHNEKLTANLAILKDYDSYSSFSELRHSLALDLVVSSQIIDSDFLVIFDSNNKPVVFYNSQEMSNSGESCVGYTLYENDSRIINSKPLSSDTFVSKNVQSKKLDFFTNYLFESEKIGTVVNFEDNLFLLVFKDIYGVQNTKVGSIVLFKLIDEEFLTSFKNMQDLSLAVKYENIFYALPDELQEYKSNIEKALFKKSENLKIEDKTIWIEERNLFDNLNIIYLSYYNNLESTIQTLKVAILISIFIIILLMVPFGYFFVKRYINNPIEKLLEDIKDFRQTNQISNKNIQLNDEFAVFQKAFYDMTNIILDKETELYLKTQEQKLANKELENMISQLKAYQIALDETSIVSKSDLNGVITYVNSKLCEKTGYAQSELIGKAHSIFKHPDTPKDVFVKLWQTITKGEIYKGVIKNRTKDGQGYYVKTTIVPIFDVNKKIKEYIAVRNDITDIMQAKKDLEESFYYDSLTKLPNRNQLLVDLENEESNKLVLLNIDSFKEINDFYGHYTGDEILLLVSQKIKSYFDTQAKVYKMPSDEYALLFNSSKISNDEIKQEVRNFIDEISDTYFSIDNIEISVNLTAGVSLHSDYSNALKDADIALKTAKRHGIFMSECDDSSTIEAEKYKNNILWAHKVKAAIKDDKIVPYYQPIYNNKTLKIEKYEVLMRLIDDDKAISPWFFLDIAKKTKLYKKLTKIIVEKSFAYFNDLDYEFSINLSAEDIESNEIKEFIMAQFEKYPNIKDKVVFEIVESEGFNNFDDIISFIKNAKMQGCKIAIDDFGTGYSNFEYLLKLKADYVKIDGSLIKNINNDKDAYEVVKIITQFATSQGMKTIAEFVSSKEIQDIMIELGVDYTQGYYISEPKAEIANKS
jgi:diguanylate cyclase (GGDEF)-like protein/PAS domain S-box-containing protein